jgi:hypothetical protein
MLEESLFSTRTESLEPRVLPLPIIDDDLDTFTIKNIPIT